MQGGSPRSPRSRLSINTGGHHQHQSEYHRQHASSPTHAGPSSPLFGAVARPRSTQQHESSAMGASPGRFATSINAFGLGTSPTTTTGGLAGMQYAQGSSREMGTEVSPSSSGSPSGSGSASRRLRRSSLLSLGQTAGPSKTAGSSRNDDHDSGNGGDQHASVFGRPMPIRRTSDKIGEPSTLSTPHQPMPRWGPGGSFLDAARKRTRSSPALPFETLTTSTPPIDMPDRPTQYGFADDADESMQDTGGRTKSPLRWVPNHMRPTSSSRKGKARADDSGGGGTLGTSGSTSPESAASSSGGGAGGGTQTFTGRPLPAPLLATLISETAPLEHEMRSEARLQRLLSSHPRASPFTPRAPRSSRGRFPETVGDEDDDEDHDFAAGRARAWTARHSWMGRRFSSDSDSDDEAAGAAALAGETVSSAFAAGMDMDRPGSSSSSSAMMFLDHHTSGKSTPGHVSSLGTGHGDHSAAQGAGQVINPGLLTPGHATAQTGFPTPPSGHGSQAWDRTKFSRLSFGNAGQGIASSPGTGIALPSAFGGLGMGTGTPLGSPTVERLELGASPGALSAASPGLMQYRESSAGSASVRPGKRKAQQDDRFDPYKRPRGTSPSFSSPGMGFPMSPGRPVMAIPIPHSPQHAPFQPSGLGPIPHLTASALGSLGGSNTTPAHRRYSRPLSRSRAASPALSIGSASGVISSSLGSLSGGGQLNVPGAGGDGQPGTGGLNGRKRGNSGSGIAFSLATAFIPTGQGQGHLSGAGMTGAPPGGLGSLGLLSLQHASSSSASASAATREGIAEDRDGEEHAIEMDRRESDESNAHSASSMRMEED